MDFVNSTYLAAATYLPNAFHKSASSYNVIAPSTTIPLTLLNPWNYFDKAWTALVGYPATKFLFTPGSTPMATFKESALFIATYYLIIFGGRELMRERPALKLNTLFIIHNYYLTAISGGLLILFVQQLIPSLWRNGLFDNVCGASGWTRELTVLYYLNYLTKYLELLDTVFLVLKKKPLTFLHTYHHGATALLCYTQLVGETSVSWVPITLNLTVHVVMYWYYAQAARGIKIWWKKYITTMQITQFILDLGFVYFAIYTYVADEYAPSLPHVGSCGNSKQELAAFSGCAILSSYLVLFIMFYFSTYKKPHGAQRALKKASHMEVPTVAESEKKATNAIRSATNAIAETVMDEKCRPSTL